MAHYQIREIDSDKQVPHSSGGHSAAIDPEQDGQLVLDRELNFAEQLPPKEELSLLTMVKAVGLSQDTWDGRGNFDWTALKDRLQKLVVRMERTKRASDENSVLLDQMQLGNLASLHELNLPQNQLTDVPAELGNLASLQRLYLAQNQLMHKAHSNLL